MPDILTRIRTLREFQAIRQEELADQLGITQAAYSRLENGRTRLDLDRLEQIARIYGFTSTDLLTLSSAELLQRLVTRSEFIEKMGGVNGDITEMVDCTNIVVYTYSTHFRAKRNHFIGWPCPLAPHLQINTG